MSQEGSRPAPARALIVFGAGAGMGRWLCHHVLGRVSWAEVELIETSAGLSDAHMSARSFDVPDLVHVTQFENFTPEALERNDGLAWTICVTSPPDALPDICQNLTLLDRSQNTLVIVSDRVGDLMQLARGALQSCQIVGCHPLFERGAPSAAGQTFFVARDRVDEDPGAFEDLLHAVGSSVEMGDPQRHDEVMTFVQQVSHQLLLTLILTLHNSGLDLNDDLWSLRTPLFETLFSLAIRLLEPAQQVAIARLQADPKAQVALDAITNGFEQLGETVRGTNVEELAALIANLRNEVPGSLFDTLRSVSARAIGAAQAIRADLAGRAADRELVGVRLRGRPESLHVGRILLVRPTEILMRDLLVSGNKGGVLAEGPGLRNARRVGANGTPRDITINLGHIEVLEPLELQEALDQRLAHLRHDVRFLVPDSVSGMGVQSAIHGFAGVRQRGVQSEAIRTGQREVVISLEIRADRDLDEVTEELRSRVERVYRWAGGICRPATCGSVSVSYLGPPGTFSEVAAHRCVEAIAVKGARLTARESMEEVLAAIAHDEIAVLPISSSSSGLVSRAVASLLRSSVDFVAGGMIDVPVRLDAYSRPGLTAESLRGSRVYSHPQALAQCTAFIQRLHLEPVACESTVEALTRCAQDEEPSAAVASTDTDVESLGLTPVKREVDDVAGAITRFLVLGTENSFGRLSEHFMPTERALVVGRITAGAELRSNPRPSSQEEWITDSDGNFLLVTSDLDYRPSDQATARFLGIVPWSPRTPIVRVGDAVVPTS